MTTPLNLVQQRIVNQQLLTTSFDDPAQLVQWMGAVQAQDYLGSLWAIGMRINASAENKIEQALANKKILRTWPMRGTLHFIAADDVRWMLRLLTPRIIKRTEGIYKQSGLDKPVFKKAQKIITHALQGGLMLTRDELYSKLEAAKIATADQRGLHILGYLGQTGVICFGTRKGKQQTFVLLDEWIPKSKLLDRDEALLTLVTRYFRSHGPATIQDFTWWSGLSPVDAKLAIALAKQNLITEKINNKIYWMMSETPAPLRKRSPAVFLLPSYDEYTVGYKDRSDILDVAYAKRAKNAIFNPVIVVNGQVVGVWKRIINKQDVEITIETFHKLSSKESTALRKAAKQYSNFLEMELTIKQI
jgi:hypothetical protein